MPENFQKLKHIAFLIKKLREIVILIINYFYLSAKVSELCGNEVLDATTKMIPLTQVL